jgi:Rieske Fe-S protein
MSRLGLALVFSSLVACDMGSSARPEPKPTTPPAPVPMVQAQGEKFGAAIDPKAESVALSEVAKNPGAYANKTFTTTGTVSAVCQHRGCWMEIKDDKGEAHIKMAGHSFFVPRTASGKKARVQATLVKSENEGTCGDGTEKHEPGKGCKAEAEAQLGRPLAKLELVAQGVELL